ncbi:MAG: MerR family transcriptional regulator [Anaerocolumna sp.]
MNHYFTISEFAKLRNININSLRYYERLGLLKPAYIDHKTNYRYYKAEQLSILDKIIMCIDLEIPLKEMAQYISNDGTLQSKKLLERGKSVAIEQMKEMQKKLGMIEYALKSIEDNKEFVDRKGMYIRNIDERHIVTTECFSQELDIKQLVKEIAQLHQRALRNNLSPLLPAGQLLFFHPLQKMRYCLFLEIVDQVKDYPNLITIPKGDYACLQFNLDLSTDFQGIVRENFGKTEEMTIIIENIMHEKYSFESRPSEIQKKV